MNHKHLELLNMALILMHEHLPMSSSELFHILKVKNPLHFYITNT